MDVCIYTYVLNLHSRRSWIVLRVLAREIKRRSSRSHCGLLKISNESTHDFFFDHINKTRYGDSDPWVSLLWLDLNGINRSSWPVQDIFTIPVVSICLQDRRTDSACAS